jgi:D-glycero-D-manno-heptose 1,7-bisphosphate phosphatase
VARGLITEAGLESVHAHMEAELERGGAHLAGIYVCPHHPTEGVAPYRRECDCRKPKPGLIERAAREMNLDLARSFVVGDAERDLAAGAALGIPGILVATGKGESEFARLRAEGRAPEWFVPDVLAAARLIVDRVAANQGR